MALLTSILLAPTGRSATACHCVHSIQNLFETFGALLCQFEEVTYGSGSQAPGFPRSSFFSCCWRLEASALSWSTASGHLWFRYRSFACIICLKCRHPKFESHHPTRRQFFPKELLRLGHPCLALVTLKLPRVARSLLTLWPNLHQFLVRVGGKIKPAGMV